MVAQEANVSTSHPVVAAISVGVGVRLDLVLADVATHFRLWAEGLRERQGEGVLCDLDCSLVALVMFLLSDREPDTAGAPPLEPGTLLFSMMVGTALHYSLPWCGSLPRSQSHVLEARGRDVAHGWKTRPLAALLASIDARRAPRYFRRPAHRDAL